MNVVIRMTNRGWGRREVGKHAPYTNITNKMDPTPRREEEATMKKETMINISPPRGAVTEIKWEGREGGPGMGEFRGVMVPAEGATK